MSTRTVLLVTAAVFAFLTVVSVFLSVLSYSGVAPSQHAAKMVAAKTASLGVNALVKEPSLKL